MSVDGRDRHVKAVGTPFEPVSERVIDAVLPGDKPTQIYKHL